MFFQIYAWLNDIGHLSATGSKLLDCFYDEPDIVVAGASVHVYGGLRPAGGLRWRLFAGLADCGWSWLGVLVFAQFHIVPYGYCKLFVAANIDPHHDVCHVHNDLLDYFVR